MFAEVSFSLLSLARSLFLSSPCSLSPLHIVALNFALRTCVSAGHRWLLSIVWGTLCRNCWHFSNKFEDAASASASASAFSSIPIISFCFRSILQGTRALIACELAVARGGKGWQSTSEKPGKTEKKKKKKTKMKSVENLRKCWQSWWKFH